MERKHTCGVAALLLLCSLNAAAQPDTMWTRVLMMDEYVVDVFQADDGGILLLSESSYSDANFRMTKISGEGDSLWSVSFGNEIYTGACHSATMLASGRILALADSGHDELDELGQRIFEIDQSGEVLSTRLLADTISWIQLAAHPHGGYVMQGLVNGVGDVDLLLQRIAADGEVVWTTVFGEPEFGERAWDMDVDESGRTLLVGIHQGYEGDVLHFDAWTALFDSLGVNTWSTIFPFTFEQSPEQGYLSRGAISEDHIIAAGFYIPSNLGYNGWLIHLGENGDSLWSRFIPNSGWEDERWISDVILTPEGDIVAAGGRRLLHGDPTSYLFRTSSSGEMQWEASGIQEGFGDDLSQRLIRLDDGGYCVANQVRDEETQSALGIRLTRTTPDDVAADPTPQLPTNFALSNFPNPFNPTTEIKFTLPRAMKTNLRVYDLLGREVATLADETMSAGTHRVSFDGSSLASGVYLCRLESATQSASLKMLLLK